jgi:hypothetical protein
MALTDNEGFPKFRRAMIQILAGVIITPLVCLSLWTWGALKFTYASGERSGFVQKLSKKGWVCKTWEGELAMANLPGTLPQIFDFTVRDDAVAAQIANTMSQRVALHYEQHRGIPFTCFGETEYFISGITQSK